MDNGRQARHGGTYPLICLLGGSFSEEMASPLLPESEKGQTVPDAGHVTYRCFVKGTPELL